MCTADRLKPHRGRITCWYLCPLTDLDGTKCFVVMGTFLDNPSVTRDKHTNTSRVLKHDLVTGEIETRNSRYTLVGPELSVRRVAALLAEMIERNA